MEICHARANLTTDYGSPSRTAYTKLSGWAKLVLAVHKCQGDRGRRLGQGISTVMNSGSKGSPSEAGADSKERMLSPDVSHVYRDLVVLR